MGFIFATINGVKAAVETDKFYEAQTEIRHLKNTIQALRDELEMMRVAKDETVQAAIVAGADVAHQLQATIAALRIELEEKVFQHADDLERQKHLSNEELRLLRETIAALREELEGRNPTNAECLTLSAQSPMKRATGSTGQKKEIGGRRSEDRRQRTEDRGRRQRTEDSSQ